MKVIKDKETKDFKEKQGKDRIELIKNDWELSLDEVAQKKEN